MPVIVLPCLNEAPALPWVLARIPDGHRVIVADNGSTDDSAGIARSHGARVVYAPQRGFGAAAHAGLLAADPDDDLVCLLDADGSCDPGQLEPLVEQVRTGAADLALGRRRPTGRNAWPAHARLGNAVIAWRLRHVSGLTLRDIGPMRVARRSALLGLDLQDRRFGYPLEMVVKAARAGWRVTERDVDYLPRAVGTKSKVTGTVRGTVRTIGDMTRVLAG